MSEDKASVDQLDALLPQTQCRECGYQGCRPYAQAIINEGESIDRCPPGGVPTLLALAKRLQQDPQLMTASVAAQTRSPQRAQIRERECIGCTKCIQACPVDAIIGSAKQMHTVLDAECTGCGLCVEPCPVDCIDMVALDTPSYDAAQARRRYQARQQRLTQQQQRSRADVMAKRQRMIVNKQAYIQAAVARVQAKRHS